MKKSDKKINYITGNEHKFKIVQSFFNKCDIKLVQKKLPLYEIQSRDGLEIALSKAEQAWKLIKEPLFVNDAYWLIPALKGFPGAYMKDINEWFEPEDFLNIMDNKTDRTIILRDTIVYIDKHGPKVFTQDHIGEILKKKCKGKYKYSLDAVVSLGKNGKSIAENIQNQKFSTEGAWKDFVVWIKNKMA